MSCVKLKLYTVNYVEFRFEVSIEKRLNGKSIYLFSRIYYTVPTLFF